MAQQNEIYVCEMCGNVLEVLDGGDGELVCCGQPMTLQKENTVDASKEKHIPVLKFEENQVSVDVGSVPHPMDANHYIMWIEVQEGNCVKRRFLKPGEAPHASFRTYGGAITVRAYCNLHGLWKAAK